MAMAQAATRAMKGASRWPHPESHLLSHRLVWLHTVLVNPVEILSVTHTIVLIAVHQDFGLVYVAMLSVVYAKNRR